MSFTNSYDSNARAASYARLDFANTYHLAFRDLPELYRTYARGTSALDFGCGTGRSTRFLRSLGFDAVGVDVSAEMLAKAREIDAQGDYRLMADGDFSGLMPASFALIQSAFTFDNIPGMAAKERIFAGLRHLLRPDGVLVSIVSTPEIYLHEWASFTTKDFPQNRDAKPDEPVRIVTTDFEDRNPCIDILCPHDSYTEIYARAGLELAEVRRPLATGDEPYAWISETRIAPWAIYVLRRAAD